MADDASRIRPTSLFWYVVPIRISCLNQFQLKFRDVVPISEIELGLAQQKLESLCRGVKSTNPTLKLTSYQLIGNPLFSITIDTVEKATICFKRF